jgi:hypothetical protein
VWDKGPRSPATCAGRNISAERATYAESVFEGFAFTRLDGTLAEL